MLLYTKLKDCVEADSDGVQIISGDESWINECQIHNSEFYMEIFGYLQSSKLILSRILKRRIEIFVEE